MSHEHFPGCGHVPEQPHNHESHEGHHHLGIVACGASCQCPAHSQTEFEHSYLQLEAARQAAEDDDEEIDPLTGRWKRRKPKDKTVLRSAQF